MCEEREGERERETVSHKTLDLDSELGGGNPLCAIPCISECMIGRLLGGKGVDRPFSRRTEAAQSDPRRNLFTCGAASNNCGVYTPKDCFPFQAAVQHKQAKAEGVVESQLIFPWFSHHQMALDHLTRQKSPRIHCTKKSLHLQTSQRTWQLQSQMAFEAIAAQMQICEFAKVKGTRTCFW